LRRNSFRAGDSEMGKLAVNAFCVGLVATFAFGLAACSKQADNGATGNTAVSSSAAGAAVASSVAAAGGQGAPAGDDGLIAQVVSVTPVNGPATAPQQVCHDEVVQRKVPPKDKHHIAGTVIGAVAGGLLGHLIGGGKGNGIATAAGVVGGGYAGNRIEKNEQDKKVENVVVHRCSTVANPGGNIVAYDVTYVYNGVTRTTRMDQDPGNVVKVDQTGAVVAAAQ
jgi:uncharacterized protein YcfJ